MLGTVEPSENTVVVRDTSGSGFPGKPFVSANEALPEDESAWESQPETFLVDSSTTSLGQWAFPRLRSQNDAAIKAQLSDFAVPLFLDLAQGSSKSLALGEGLRILDAAPVFRFQPIDDAGCCFLFHHRAL